MGKPAVGASRAFYQEADKISKDNKEFIKGLFPAGPIHASLFAEIAQVIGQVGKNTQGVQKMLENRVSLCEPGNLCGGLTRSSNRWDLARE